MWAVGESGVGCISFYSEFVYSVTNRAYLTISIPFRSYILRLSCAKNCFAYLHQFVFYYVSNGPLALDTTYPIGWVSCVIWWGNLYQCFSEAALATGKEHNKNF